MPQTNVETKAARAAVHGILKAATNGGERRENDFYPTPAWVTEALIPKLNGWPRDVWEPAVGDGGIAQPLENSGFRVIGTDLIHRGYVNPPARGYGPGPVDFLKCDRIPLPCSAIITNPPFGKLVTPFIRHAVLTLRAPYVAMLVNVNLWHAANRRSLFETRRPAVVYACQAKPDFSGAGRPYFNVIWTVWTPEPATYTRYELLARPPRAERIEW